MQQRSLKSTDMSLQAVYRTPSGRFCRLALPDKRRKVGDGSMFHFEYLDGPAQHMVSGDGFNLSADNVPMLRLVVAR
jgi:hypothetical protein